MSTNNRDLIQEFGRYVIPSVIAQWVFALYGMVDGMFVARGVGELALSAVNLSLPAVNLIFSLSLVLAVGSSTIISIHLGRNEGEQANQVYSQNIVTALLLSLVLAGAILLNLERIAVFLGATADTLDGVMTYVGTVAAFCPGFVLSYYFEILIKADGQPRLATILVIAGTALNCILDYVFVFVVPWGIFGAALATGISQLAVTLLFVGYFLSKRAKLRLRRFRLSPTLFFRTLRLGLSSGLAELSSGLMIFLFNRTILAYLGQDAIVSYTIVAYVNTIVVMSMTGIAQGVQPMMSYYHGQGSTKLPNRLLKYGLLCSGAVSVVSVLVSVLLADPIVSIFISPEHEALRIYSADVMRIFCLSFLLVGVNILVGGYFTALERPYSSLAISLGRGVVFLTLSLFVLSYLFGGEGIWWAPLLSEGLCLVTTLLLLFNRRRLGKRREDQRAAGVET